MKADSRGFSLMEVIVAIAILGIGIVGVLQLFSGSLRTVKKAEEHSIALNHARSLLDEAYAMADVREAEDNFDLPGGFKAERTVRHVSSDKDASLYEIRVAVSWPYGKVELRGTRAFNEKTR